MTKDYERRIRNLEKIVTMQAAIIGQALPTMTESELELVSEDFFYSISRNRIKDDIDFEPPI